MAVAAAVPGSSSGALARDMLLVLLVALILICVSFHMKAEIRPVQATDQRSVVVNVLQAPQAKDETSPRPDDVPYVAPTSGGPHRQVLADLIKRHTSLQEQLLSGGVPLTRAVIAQCHHGQICAGLGDRLFGILALYLGAILTDRAFFIDHTKPHPLENFLEPNGLEWRLDKATDPEMRKSLKECSEGQPKFRDCTFIQMLLPLYKCGAILSSMTSSQPVMVLASNHRTDCLEKILETHEILPPESETGRVFGGRAEEMRMWAANVSHMLFHHLFKFRPEVVKAAESVIPESKRPLNFDCTVCIHVRSGTGLREKPRHTNYRDFARCAMKAEFDFASDKVCKVKPAWLIVSDNMGSGPRILDMVTNLTVINTNALGAPVHIENSRAEVAGILHSFADFYLLTRCRLLVASLSTFSATAGIVHGAAAIRFDVELHRDTGACRQMKLSDYQRDANLKTNKFLR